MRIVIEWMRTLERKDAQYEEPLQSLSGSPNRTRLK